MKIVVTVREIMDAPLLGAWEKYCDLTGTNFWAVNEGLLDSSEEVSIPLSFAKEIGLLGKDDEG